MKNKIKLLLAGIGLLGITLGSNLFDKQNSSYWKERQKEDIVQTLSLDNSFRDIQSKIFDLSQNRGVNDVNEEESYLTNKISQNFPIPQEKAHSLLHSYNEFYSHLNSFTNKNLSQRIHSYIRDESVRNSMTNIVNIEKEFGIDPNSSSKKLYSAAIAFIIENKQTRLNRERLGQLSLEYPVFRLFKDSLRDTEKYSKTYSKGYSEILTYLDYKKMKNILASELKDSDSNKDGLVTPKEISEFITSQPENDSLVRIVFPSF